MRILLVNYRYFISGGPERYMFNVKKALEELGHEVIPFSIHSNNNVETPYSSYFVEPIGGRDAVYFEDCKKTPETIIQMFSRSVYSLEVKRAIEHEIADVKPDIVYIIHFVNKLSPSVIDGAKKMGVPVVLRLSDFFLLCPKFDFLFNKQICDDCLSKGYFSCIKKRCVKGSLAASFIRVFSMKTHMLMRVYDNVDAFVCPSRFLMDKLSENGFDRKRMYHIPTFTLSSIEENEDRVGEYGLYFGRISEEKGVESVVKAYEILNDHRVIIMGDDSSDLGIELRKYTKDHGLSNIDFVGKKEGVELEEIVRNARFVIIPSICFDNLPNTAIEAFAKSKPVLASDLGSLPELVEEGKNGFLFEPNNPKKLAEAIIKLDDDETVKRMGRNSRDKLISKFTKQAHMESLIQLFESLEGSCAE